MEGQSGLSELSVILWVSAVEGVVSVKQGSTVTQLILLLFNVRSLYPKIDYLKTECVDHKPDIVCPTETWLDNGITNDELFISDSSG